MKSLCFVIGLALAVCQTVKASVYTIDFNGINAAIPDGNINGMTDTRTIALGNRAPEQISDVNVTLNISGGNNGDLYAYLVHSSGFVVLLNRVGRTASDGFGYDDTGVVVKFDDSASTDVHGYQTVSYSLNGSGQLTGTWRPDGRRVDPATVVDTDSRTALLSSFNGGDPNGAWTLFLADMVDGEQGTLASWQLQISTVPEPVIVALIIFGCVAAASGTVKVIRARLRKAQKSRYQMYLSVP